MNGIVLDSVRDASLAFTAVMFLFATLEPVLIDDKWVGLVVALDLLVGVLAATTFAAIKFGRPSPKFAHAICFWLGVLAVFKICAQQTFRPDLHAAQHLSIVMVAVGSIMLSMAWLSAFLPLAIGCWFGVGLAVAPEMVIGSECFVVLSAAIVSLLISVIRIRSSVAVLDFRRLESRKRSSLTLESQQLRRLNEISRRFLLTEPGEFERRVIEALGTIGRGSDADHAYIIRFTTDTGEARIVHEWCSAEVTPATPLFQDFSVDRFPWILRRLLRGEPICVHDVSKLPDEADIFRETLSQIGSRSFMAVPMVSSVGVWGCLALASRSRFNVWQREQTAVLSMAADVFLGAIERERSREALAKSRERIERLLESNVVGIFSANIDGLISDANDEFLRISGYHRDDLPIHWTEMTPPEWSSADQLKVKEIASTGFASAYEKEYIRKDKTRIPVLVGGALLPGSRGETISFALDLSELKEAEKKINALHGELARSSRLGTLGQIAAGLAHEIHQPLAVISNYSAGGRLRIDAGTLDTPTMRGLFEDIHKHALRAGEILARIRDFVAERDSIREPVDVAKMVDECLYFARFDTREAGVNVHRQIAEGLPPIRCDRTQVAQILMNLLLNAVQAMSDVDEPRELTVRAATGAPGEIEIRVDDTGTGISSDAVSKIFDQFYTSKSKGLGLGLPICLWIAESHGGSLSVETTGPMGTTFLLKLPIDAGTGGAFDGKLRGEDSARGEEKAIAVSGTDS
ncbi:Sensor protein FixL [Stratiformator vulcanicus]|uniref:histidine kinase n=2 Tax=Stratiformator vulcanicus TaxID=2527980 RepID=A0A517R4Z4_9PLAN|nr:Sensor protein FixL [Stratiformator vulcanicus]